ncbi:MAG: ATP-binding protein [Chloroflexi bacterium]|nr:ATP-binding protein [Chloroflexota bacterium]
MSTLIGLVRSYVHIENISMLYLIVVMAAAIAFGRGPAIAASVAAFLIFDWFFVQPFNSITVSDPAEWLALLLLLLTAMVTGQLMSAVRHRAVQAQQREREATVLYDVVRLMSDGDLNQSLQAVAERLRGELELAGVIIALTDRAGSVIRATAGEEEALQLAEVAATLPRQVLHLGHPPRGDLRAAAGDWVRILPSRLNRRDPPSTDHLLWIVPVTVHDRRIGVLTLVRPSTVGVFNTVEDRLLSALSVQLGLTVERLRLQREVLEAEVLRRTDELKTALLNAVSHDLRTPLASIIASAGSLRQQDVLWTEAERQEFAQAIEEEAQRLNDIVGNLLDLSRIEGGSLHPEKGWYDLGALVDDVLGRLRPRTAHHLVHVAVPVDLPPVPLDYVEIDQVLSNLIENAAKYTPAGTEIEVCAKRNGDEVELEVADRGPGIPLDALPRLFEPFYRVDGLGPRPQGTGVGLSVAKGLVEAHGGRIWAENRPDGGACFAFTLPLPEANERTDGQERRP